MVRYLLGDLVLVVSKESRLIYLFGGLVMWYVIKRKKERYINVF